MDTLACETVLQLGNELKVGGTWFVANYLQKLL
jgi:hypothetical protein